MAIWKTSLIFILLFYACSAVFLPYGTNNGDTALGIGDDVSWKVTTEKQFKFLGKFTKEFYVSSNGAIFTESYNQIDPSRNFQLLPKHSLLVYFADAKFDDTCLNVGCNVYSRASLSLFDSALVENFIRKLDNNFSVDRKRSVVITWFNARAYHEESDNTFQAVITSDGSKTYAILSYEKLNYYNNSSFSHRYAKVGFKANQNNICQFPGSNTEPVTLACRSNVNKPGVFVVGLTTNSALKCNRERLSFDCSHCRGEETWLNKICTHQYAPVCGSNGQTFSNLCEFQKGVCRSNGTVTLAHTGRCLVSSIQPSRSTFKATSKFTPRMSNPLPSISIKSTVKNTTRKTTVDIRTVRSTRASKTIKPMSERMRSSIRPARSSHIQQTASTVIHQTTKQPTTRTRTGTRTGTDRTTRTRTFTGTRTGTGRTTRTRTFTGTRTGTGRTTRTRTFTPTPRGTDRTTRKPTNPPSGNGTAVAFCGFETGSCSFTGISIFGPWIRHRGNTPTNFTGPSTDANGNPQGYYVYYEASTFRKASINFTYTYLGIPTIGCAQISVHMNGSGVGTLTATLRLSISKPLKLLEVNGSQGNTWHKYQFNIPLFQRLDFSFEAIPTFDFRGDIALDNLAITVGKCLNETSPSPLPNTTHTIPYVNATTPRPSTTTPIPRRVIYCDFEDGICGLSVGNWLRDCCGTPSTGTGPNVDASGSRTGYYIYREATGQPAGSSSSITLNIRNPDRLNSGCLRFAYHMYGSAMGVLRVNAIDAIIPFKEIFRVGGNQGNQWYFKNISLSNVLSSRPTFTRISFDGVIGSNYESDIALDEISVTLGGSCGEVPSTNITDENLLYPHGFFMDSSASRGRFRTTTVYLPQNIPLFSVKRNRFYISTSGIVSFNTAITRSRIPSTNTHLSIFYLDLDTSRGGNIFYRYTTDRQTLERANRDVRRLGNNNFSSRIAIIVTYSNVPYSFSSSALHTFQLVLATDGNVTFAIVNYQRLDQISFNVGYSETLCNYRRFGSSSSRLTTSSNVGVRGRHVYQLTNFECFKPITGVSLFQWTTAVSTGVSSISSYNRVIPNSRDGNVDIAVIEMIGLNPHIIFLKQILSAWQHYSVFSFSFSVLYESKLIQLAVVYEGTPVNSTFQYGQINTTTFSSNIGCLNEIFTTKMQVLPSIKLTVDIGRKNNDILRHAYVWLRDVSEEGFKVCYKEAYTLSGSRKITINYIAVALSSKTSPNTTEQFKENGRHQFQFGELCSRVFLRYSYVKTPQVFTTPVQMSRRSASPIMAWVRKTGTNYFDVCVKTTNNDVTDNNISVDYIVRGHISPCTYFNCPDHLECTVGVGNVPYCGCIKSCFNTTADEGFCGTDFTFYINQCEIDRLHCYANGNNTKSNVTIAYRGKCEGFPYQSGVTQLDNVPGVPVAFCSYISLNKVSFHPSKALRVQLSVSWGMPIALNTTKNEATAAWSEDVTVHGFKACVMVAGRHFFGISIKPYVHWAIYQDGFVNGNGNMEAFVLNLTTWYTGSNCVRINTKRYINSRTQVLVSVQHTLPRTYENAMTAWAEANGRTICAREFQNFDGKHSGIKLHVLVIHSAKSLFISERGSIVFPRRFNSIGSAFTAVCQTVAYNSNYPSLPNPTVIVSPVTPQHTFSRTFSPLGITAWIENAGATQLSICYKSIRTNTYTEEVRISYVVLPALCEYGWSYVSGSCYRSLNRCATYSSAKQRCNAINATLPTVDTEGEQYYLAQTSPTQTWIGLTDQANEDTWVWDTGRESSFRKWLPGRPNGGRSENCAVVERAGNLSGWEDLSCYSCANIQCEKDANLLNRSCAHFCRNGGVCSSIVHPISGNINMSCSCPNGIYGKRCEIDVGALEECSNYTSHNEEWRRLGSSSSFTLQSNDTSCDAKDLKEGWHRFNGAAGTQLQTFCTASGTQCGTRSPGWVIGANPLVEDGIVTRRLHYRTFYCADDRGEVQIRNCGNFYTYKFIKLPYWSCQFGVCTKN